MIIDFHVHAKITRGFPFIEENFIKYVEKAKSEKINALAITEHSDATGFDKASQFLSDNYEYDNDYYEVNGVKIFIGVEVTTAIDIEILFIGNRNDISILRDKIIRETESGKNIDIDRLFELHDYSDILVIIAHPFRNHDDIPVLSESVLSKIDAIEYNVSDLYKHGVVAMQNKIDILSKKIDIPVIGGSDSHYYFQLGTIKTIFDAKVSTVKEMKEQIKMKKFEVEIAENIELKVRMQKVIKSPLVSD